MSETLQPKTTSQTLEDEEESTTTMLAGHDDAEAQSIMPEKSTIQSEVSPCIETFSSKTVREGIPDQNGEKAQEERKCEEENKDSTEITEDKDTSGSSSDEDEIAPASSVGNSEHGEVDQNAQMGTENCTVLETESHPPTPLQSESIAKKQPLPHCQPSDFSEYMLLGLPSDAIHAVASFLSPKDFCNFGLCSSGATKVCRDIFRKVRVHGFLCATEIVTAWVSSC